nr:C-type lectin BfL-2-like [Pelodiscus sinensis]|eukprot:XP_006121317.1 C-type lectin BfL-2-like [Pelodiscus sinensis]
MGPVAFFSLCLLGCLIFNPSLEASPRRERALQPGSGRKAAACSRGWFHYRDHCYKFFSEKLTWSDAEIECQHEQTGAHLASILNDAETNIVAQYLSTATSTDRVWIGLHDPNKDKTWLWTDGSRFRYRTWMAGEPNNDRSREYCVEMYASTGYKKWNDVTCEREAPYLCKYQPKPEEPLAPAQEGTQHPGCK